MINFTVKKYKKDAIYHLFGNKKLIQLFLDLQINIWKKKVFSCLSTKRTKSMSPAPSH